MVKIWKGSVMKMIRTSTISRVTISAGLLLVCWVAAAAQDIRYNSKPGIDFSKYKTYKWARVPKADYPNQILDGQIMQAIDSQMSLKGLSRLRTTTLSSSLHIRRRSISKENGTPTAPVATCGDMVVGVAGVDMAVACQVRGRQNPRLMWEP